ncbi:glycosyl transferase family 2 [Candidatus Roizmanbacteria bacterium CG_4_10_14_0_2_um_filter_36_35]|uniref:Glycosyl transferase family 2 n=4 Tax=Candidatus Roizmaniibacteriota TaxID=1752723 RepID=A0A2M7BXG7_9BACT|nr:MAG: glycosyl transferase family 2 [Candidatus Roizmanbacteria bacterium CG11_big_fil_rev_8_21_14_0_20_35_14]PIV11266.1 MAG: glycosyl transferase family 2 [Candidatus Roizmanbacteria bacterium CG03_land_8_20_14_0_80_35_26]PIZ67421.1 MAG: glycosyl transferase family 2 [Candidatus Roizmanbacteria bacterium CG_4_10_14_0_2_um_filter_36_35]PJC32981.1 MAG: glycosyl transferase family 2 [Candidatus Roizmanbacteria bacterium CG_4_9_14_0_2_um_filter_36_12]PJC80452.1 MAG: glycosyl transferase family 2
MIDLSIIIVSFNTEKITNKCLVNLRRNLKKYPLNYQVVVVDNGSKDGSIPMLKKIAVDWKNLKVVLSNKNLGFGKGNNLGVTNSKGKYILYLNSDAIITDIDFFDLINVFKTKPDLGALTVKVVLSTGEIDPASHRGFPTIWRSFTYFLGLEKIFKNTFLLNKIFGGYHLVNLNLKEIHEIDVPTGAFLFTRRDIIDKIGGFDEDYFSYGEDIEMAFQIKKLGYKIIYYPLWQMLHLKSVSGLKKTDQKIRKKTSFYFYDSMKIFYRKHYAKSHNWLTNKLIYLAVDLKRKLIS